MQEAAGSNPAPPTNHRFGAHQSPVTTRSG